MKAGFKKIMGALHLWLGLLSGLVVFVSMLAAAVFVWDEELTGWYHREKVFVPAVLDRALPFETLRKAAEHAVDGQRINSLEITANPERAYVFGRYKNSEHPGFTWASTMDYYERIYVDPYTGKVLGQVDLRHDWIFCARMLHQCLLINYDVGHYIVGFATLFIIVLTITGLILWWPKNKAALKQRIWFRWKDSTKWKRKNYDLHNIGGFYSMLLILLFAVTGLVWTFDWWTDTIYRLLGNDPEKVFAKAPEIAPAPYIPAAAPMDRIIADAGRRTPGWHRMSMGVPAGGDSAARKVGVFVRFSSGRSGWDESDQLTYNSLTGNLHFAVRHGQKTLGAKWRNSNYAIHVGSIYGITTKLIATFISLFCASLPLTGFLIWWGRRKKGNSPPKKKEPRAGAGKPRTGPNTATNIRPRIPDGSGNHTARLPGPPGTLLTARNILFSAFLPVSFPGDRLPFSCCPDRPFLKKHNPRL